MAAPLLVRWSFEDSIRPCARFRGGIEGMMRNYANLAALISTFSYREQQLLERDDEVLASLSEAPS